MFTCANNETIVPKSIPCVIKRNITDEEKLALRNIGGAVLLSYCNCSNCYFRNSSTCELYNERLEFITSTFLFGGPIIDEFERCAACQADILPSEYKSFERMYMNENS